MLLPLALNETSGSVGKGTAQMGTGLGRQKLGASLLQGSAGGGL